jgi:hypothetical protein
MGGAKRCPGPSFRLMALTPTLSPRKALSITHKRSWSSHRSERGRITMFFSDGCGGCRIAGGRWRRVRVAPRGCGGMEVGMAMRDLVLGAAEAVARAQDRQIRPATPQRSHSRHTIAFPIEVSASSIGGWFRRCDVADTTGEIDAPSANSLAHFHLPFASAIASPMIMVVVPAARSVPRIVQYEPSLADGVARLHSCF